MIQNTKTTCRKSFKYFMTFKLKERRRKATTKSAYFTHRAYIVLCWSGPVFFIILGQNYFNLIFTSQLLCILNRERVLHTLFAGRNNLYLPVRIKFLKLQLSNTKINVSWNQILHFPPGVNQLLGVNQR